MDATEIRAKVLAANAAYGCTEEEVSNGTPILYVSIRYPSGDRNCRRGWVASYAWAVEFADNSFAAAVDSDGMFAERFLRRFEAAASGPTVAAKAFKREASDAGVSIRIHDARR